MDEIFKALYDFSMDAILLTVPDGNIIHANPAACEVFEMTEDEIKNAGRFGLVDTTDPRLPILLEERQRTGKARGEITLIRKNGKKFPAELSSNLFTTASGEQRTCMIIRDITKRKLAEEEINRLNQNLEKLVAEKVEEIRQKNIFLDKLMISQPVAFYVAKAGKNFPIIFITDTIKNITGFTMEQIMQDETLWSNSIHPDDLKTLLPEVEKTIATANEGKLEFRIKTADGIWHWVFDHFTVEKQKNGENHIYGMLMDITDRKKNEMEIKNKNIELQNTNKELEQFIFILSHDLKEPLRMITAYSKLIAGKCIEENQDIKEYSGILVESAARMQYMFDDLLEYENIGSEKTGYKMVDSGLILEEVKVNFIKEIENTHAEILKKSELPLVYCNPQHLFIIFRNLISNGLKFSKENIKPEIEIKAEKIGKYWQFSVKDNGIGMNQEYQEKIFTIFKRLHTRDQYPGSGIGLALVKKLIENKGGKVWFESEEGKGTTFYFTLPAQEFAENGFKENKA